MNKPVRSDLIHHSINGTFAIRRGDWKLILAKGSGGWSAPPRAKPGEKLPMTQLYNLKDDPGEQHNLQAEYPDTVKEMSALLSKHKGGGFSNPVSKN